MKTTSKHRRILRQFEHLADELRNNLSSDLAVVIESAGYLFNSLEHSDKVNAADVLATAATKTLKAVEESSQ
jgi:hypothetical protein